MEYLKLKGGILDDLYGGEMSVIIQGGHESGIWGVLRPNIAPVAGTWHTCHRPNGPLSMWHCQQAGGHHTPINNSPQPPSLLPCPRLWASQGWSTRPWWVCAAYRPLHHISSSCGTPTHKSNSTTPCAISTSPYHCRPVLIWAHTSTPNHPIMMIGRIQIHVAECGVRRSLPSQTPLPCAILGPRKEKPLIHNVQMHRKKFNKMCVKGDETKKKRHDTHVWLRKMPVRYHNA